MYFFLPSFHGRICSLDDCKHVFDVCVMNWLYRIRPVMIKGDDDGYNIITYLDILSLNNKNSFPFVEPSVLSAIKVPMYNLKVSFQDVCIVKQKMILCFVYS